MDIETRIQNCIDAIVAWYPAVRRPLPWRENVTPYRVWISEIMLQQTRIETVIPYYARFLAAFPDPRSLAEAEEDRLLKLWEGLGYYSRARNLKKAAQQITAAYGGELPRTAAALRTLPGIGDYTAGAIASIAWGEPEPAVDGNVLRVLARVLASGEDVMLPRTRADMTALLRRHYPAGARAALATEGLMELGETLCAPNTPPDCARCPLQALCLAHEAGSAERFPVRTPPKARRVEERTVLLLCCGGRWAVRRREERGLLAGLWEFPNVSGCLDEAAAREAVRRMGGEPLACEPCGAARHLFTHIEWHMTGYILPLKAEITGLVWESAEQLRASYSIPTALKAYLKKIE